MNEEVLQLVLTNETNKHSRPFSSVIVHDKVFAGSKDGKLLIIDKSSLQPNLSTRLHSSWISSLISFEDIVITGSYDSSICAFSLSTNNFSQFTFHSDYILSLSMSEKILASTCSDQTVAVSSVSPSSISKIHSFPLRHSAHASFFLNNQIFLGKSNGSISFIDFREGAEKKLSQLKEESCIKCIDIDSNEASIGTLDGKMKQFDIRNFEVLHESQEEASKIIKIQTMNNSKIVFFQSGIIMFNKIKVSLGTEIEAASCLDDQTAYVSLRDGKLIQINLQTMKTVNELHPSNSFVKVKRIPGTMLSLCKDSNGKMSILDMMQLTIEPVKENKTWKNLLKDMAVPSKFWSPIDSDVSTGTLNLIFRPILQKLVESKTQEETRILNTIIKNAIEKDVPARIISSSGKIISTGTIRNGIPFWMRYLNTL